MGKHLDFYYKYLPSGFIPGDGLCECAIQRRLSQRILDLFEPNSEEWDALREEGLARVFWGSGFPVGEALNHSFTPLRQTIVLFMAAMNNEL